MAKSISQQRISILTKKTHNYVHSNRANQPNIHIKRLKWCRGSDVLKKYSTAKYNEWKINDLISWYFLSHISMLMHRVFLALCNTMQLGVGGSF